MFFLHKNDIEDFQNRCVMAIFLDTHPEVELYEYIDKNHINGMFFNEIHNIYIFNSPTNNTENDVVFRYKNSKEKENVRYRIFDSRFISEYLVFVDNPFEYIKNNFEKKNWTEKYKTLFITNPPQEMELYKYKFDPNENDKDSVSIFDNFVSGDLTFVNPEECNDPFDCDCEFGNVLSILIYKAILKTKYSENAVSVVPIEKINQVIGQVLEEESERREISENELRRIITGIYRDKKINDIKIDIIIKNYYSMTSQVINLKKEFRILCMAKNPQDILMWGYYGDSGKGLCVKHLGKDIQNAIEHEHKGSICIYGNINYPETNTKPQLQAKMTDMVDAIFSYIVECTFTKYKKWEHEEEFRYVLIGEEFNSNYIPVHSVVDEYYLGCKHTEVSRYGTTAWTKKPIKLRKHAKEYRLEIDN